MRGVQLPPSAPVLRRDRNPGIGPERAIATEENAHEGVRTASPSRPAFRDPGQATGAAINARGSGLLAGESLGDLSYDRFSNRMLGVGNSGIAGGGAHLYQVDLVTGVATNLSAIAGMTEGFAVSLAVRPTDGTIFVHGTQTNRWYSVNPGTLVATALNPVGLNSNHEQGASFSGDGVLYHSLFITDHGFGSFNNLASINPTTGTPSYNGFIGVGLANISDIAFVPAPWACSLLAALSSAVAARELGPFASSNEIDWGQRGGICRDGCHVDVDRLPSASPLSPTSSS